jgi:putative multiple sugar transport system substrate-binding protein
MKKNIKILSVSAIATSLVLTLAACGSNRNSVEEHNSVSASASGESLIGISLPTKSQQRWNLDGAHLQQVLAKDGYQTSLQYASNNVSSQISQIQTMINSGAKVLIVAAIDGTSLSPILAQAHAHGVKVIAYDHLVMGTPDVDYYVTFDNYKVGQLQGQYIADTLDLKNAKGPYNFEPFSGDPEDNNSSFFFAGAWDVLKPYVDNGELVIPSGNKPASDKDWTKIGVANWDSAMAQSLMQTRLNSFYAGGKRVNAILAPNDTTALGIEQALAASGYVAGPNWPVVTGQDCDLPNVKNILAGKQSMCVWKNTPQEGDIAAQMVQAILSGGKAPVNNTTSYNNGVKDVSSYLLQPQVVTKGTVESILVKNGFYTQAQLGLG